jgi:hypothetical protein
MFRARYVLINVFVLISLSAQAYIISGNAADDGLLKNGVEQEEEGQLFNDDHGGNDDFPTLSKLALHLNISTTNIDQISSKVSAMNVRFTVDILRSVISAKASGVSIADSCVLFTPTYYIHIDDAEIAKAFKNNRRGLYINITTFVGMLDGANSNSNTSSSGSSAEEVDHQTTERRRRSLLKVGLREKWLQTHNTTTALSTNSTITTQKVRKSKAAAAGRGTSSVGSPLKMWIHTEKTGGSFAPTAQILGYKWIGHSPSPIEGCIIKNCRLISLFRDPTQRAASWFYFSKFSKACVNHREHDLLMNCFKKHVDELYNKDSRVTIWGCQAKMILGYHCEARRSQLPSALQSEGYMGERAVEVLWRDYDFVGITDDFDASVTLSHQMLGGQLDLNSALVKMNTREQVGHYFKTASVDSQLTTVATGPPTYILPSVPLTKYKECFEYPCDNKPDEVVFQAVKKMFIRNILLYHNTPVRIIDTEKFSEVLHVPKETHNMDPALPYMQNLTNNPVLYEQCKLCQLKIKRVFLK